MIDMKKVYEDAVVGAGVGAMPADVQAAPGGAISDVDILGHCDHNKEGGYMKDGCFHLPKSAMPLQKRDDEILAGKKKKGHHNDYIKGMKILKEGELKHSYTGEAYKMSQKIYATVDEVHIDVLYFVEDFGFAWKLNNKGYIHVYMPNKVKMNGEMLYYSIKHCMLTDKNELKDIGTFGSYKNKEEALKVIKEQCKA